MAKHLLKINYQHFVLTRTLCGARSDLLIVGGLGPAFGKKTWKLTHVFLDVYNFFFPQRIGTYFFPDVQELIFSMSFQRFLLYFT